MFAMLSTPSPETETPLSETDELSHLAALTGYSEEPVTPAVPSTHGSALLDPEDFETGSDPITQPQLWSNPWAKAAFVGSGLAIAIGLVALFLHSVHAPSKSPVADETTPAVEAPIDPTTHADADPSEIGRLKTVEALGSQAEALKAEKAQPEPTLPTITTTPIPATAVASPPPPVIHPAPVTYAPPPTYSAPVRSAPVAAIARSSLNQSRSS
jgi:hypothetical protein